MSQISRTRNASGQPQHWRLSLPMLRALPWRWSIVICFRAHSIDTYPDHYHRVYNVGFLLLFFAFLLTNASCLASWMRYVPWSVCGFAIGWHVLLHNQFIKQCGIYYRKILGLNIQPIPTVYVSPINKPKEKSWALEASELLNCTHTRNVCLFPSFFPIYKRRKLSHKIYIYVFLRGISTISMKFCTFYQDSIGARRWRRGRTRSRSTDAVDKITSRKRSSRYTDAPHVTAPAPPPSLVTDNNDCYPLMLA